MKGIDFEWIESVEEFSRIDFTEEEYRRFISNRWIVRHFYFPLDEVEKFRIMDKYNPNYKANVFFEKLGRHEKDILKAEEITTSFDFPTSIDENGRVYVPAIITFKYLRDADRRLTEEDRKNRESIKKALAESNSKKR